MSATEQAVAGGRVRPVRWLPASVLVIAAWLAAVSTAVFSIYSPGGVVILCVVVVALLASLWFGAFQAMPSAWVVALLAVGAVVGLLITAPLTNVDRTGWLLPAVVVGGVASLSALVVFLRGVPSGRLALVPLGLTAVAFAGVIFGGVPRIDVWVIFQDSARGLLHGANPYTMSFPNVPAGQTSDCFNYLPATFLVTSPSEWLFGDVRWVEAACVLATGALLAWQVASSGASRSRVALAVLVSLTPGALLVVQQAWNEPLLLLGLVAGAVLMQRGRWNWAMLPLGLALATKQHLVLLLPVLLWWPRFGWRRVLGTVAVAGAVSMPWFVANPGRFTTCTADFFLDRQAPDTALSVWRLLPTPIQLPALLLGLALAFAVVLLRCPRTPAGFLVAAGTVFAVFDLLNKQTFVNQWWLAVALLVAGMALHGGRDGPDEEVAVTPVASARAS